MKTDKVLDRLVGRDPEKVAQIKDRIWYDRWVAFALTVETQTPRDIMQAAFQLIESCKGHGYTRVASASLEAMNFVCEMKHWK